MEIGRSLWQRRIALRDGTELAADVLLPGSGEYPSVVLFTPYGRSRSLGNPNGWIQLVGRGYGLVTVDIRGRGDSDGDWTPWIKRPDDAHDVIEWVAAQPWSTGKVGMVGASYEARTQWWAAVGRPAHLACITPLAVSGAQRDRPFGTGIPIQYFLWWMTMVLGRTTQYPGAVAWEGGMAHLPIRELDARLGLTSSYWQRYLDGEIDYAGDRATLTPDDFASIEVPVLIGVGWWDDQETFRTWLAVQSSRRASECRLLVGAWDHGGNLAPRPSLGGFDFEESAINTFDHIEKFLRLHLKGEDAAIAREPRCRIFCTGENRWHELDHWPDPRGVETPYYLTSESGACGLGGDGYLATDPNGPSGADTFRFDPEQPSRDMSNLSLFAFADPPLDRRYLQRRRDVLVYTSDILPEDLLVSGRYRLCLFVSSDCVDTDFFADLSDVHPDGRAMGLAATNEPGASLRLRYRNGRIAEDVIAGQVYEIEIEGTWLHHVFRQGHRIRIAISSGDFPFYARNLGSADDAGFAREPHRQTNSVHHSLEMPSRLILPVVPGRSVNALS